MKKSAARKTNATSPHLMHTPSPFPLRPPPPPRPERVLSSGGRGVPSGWAGGARPVPGRGRVGGPTTRRVDGFGHPPTPPAPAAPPRQRRMRLLPQGRASGGNGGRWRVGWAVLLCGWRRPPQRLTTPPTPTRLARLPTTPLPIQRGSGGARVTAVAATAAEAQHEPTRHGSPTAKVGQGDRVGVVGRGRRRRRRRAGPCPGLLSLLLPARFVRRPPP